MTVLLDSVRGCSAEFGRVAIDSVTLSGSMKTQRGGRRQFTYSKVMAWVALDRSVRDAERFKLEAPLERWRELRDRMHATICKCGFDTSRKTFTQSPGSSDLDASLLLLPTVGFLPPADRRIRGTVAAKERELVVDGLVMRYRTSTEVDGLPPGEGPLPPLQFLARRQLHVAAATRRHVPFSSGCYRCATMSAYWRRSTTLTRDDRSETFRRHSHMSP